MGSKQKSDKPKKSKTEKKTSRKKSDNGKTASPEKKKPSNYKKSTTSESKPEKPKNPNANVDTSSYKDILSEEQRYVVQLALEKHNMCIIGPAGTGKTLLLRALVEILTDRGVNVSFTAMTGTAACHLGQGAMVFHSWTGSSTAFSASPEQELFNINKNPKAIKRWKEAQYVIIDEASMLSPAFLEKLNYVAREIRGTAQPFGGLILILVGDFFQNKPVVTKSDWGFEEFKDKVYCFESDLFRKHIKKIVALNTIFRQARDKVYRNLLEEIRLNKLSPEGYDLLCGRVNAKLDIPHDIKPTILLPRRKDVDAINKNELAKLPGQLNTYNMVGRYTKDIIPSRGTGYIRDISANCTAEQLVELKVGSPVVLIVNADIKNGLANGTQGQVKGFVEMFDSDVGTYQCPIVQFIGQKESIPTPYWVWEYDKRRNRDVTKQTEFSGAYVKQIPLKLAFALTVHKSQGMTLHYVQTCIDSNMFSEGQAYVALSRVTKLSGLTLTKMDRIGIKSDPRVEKFYKKYAGVKSTSVPNNSKLFTRELKKAKGELPESDDEEERDKKQKAREKEKKEARERKEKEQREKEEREREQQEREEQEREKEEREREQQEREKETRRKSKEKKEREEQESRNKRKRSTNNHDTNEGENKKQKPDEPSPPTKPRFVPRPEDILEGKDYYYVLGLDVKCKIDDIKKAYKKLSLKWHPDKISDPDMKKLGEENFKSINSAHSTLSDIRKRRDYDLARRWM